MTFWWQWNGMEWVLSHERSDLLLILYHSIRHYYYSGCYAVASWNGHTLLFEYSGKFWTAITNRCMTLKSYQNWHMFRPRCSTILVSTRLNAHFDSYWVYFCILCVQRSSVVFIASETFQCNFCWPSMLKHRRYQSFTFIRFDKKINYIECCTSIMTGQSLDRANACCRIYWIPLQIC